MNNRLDTYRNALLFLFPANAILLLALDHLHYLFVLAVLTAGSWRTINRKAMLHAHTAIFSARKVAT